jgi:hypothetical protein
MSCTYQFFFLQFCHRLNQRKLFFSFLAIKVLINLMQLWFQFLRVCWKIYYFVCSIYCSISHDLRGELLQEVFRSRVAGYKEAVYFIGLSIKEPWWICDCFCISGIQLETIDPSLLFLEYCSGIWFSQSLSCWMLTFWKQGDVQHVCNMSTICEKTGLYSFMQSYCHM